MIKSLLAKYSTGGLLPVWELSSNETGTMIGYHSVPVIVDAYMKGLKGFDIEKAFTAMKHSADMDHLGLKSYKELNYVASDQEHESVSKTLEYAYDDWCIAMLAKKLGKEDDYKKFSNRAMNYKNLFDGYNGFMRGRKTNGSWSPLFNPYAVTRDFTEANAWQYSLYVPQDVEGLRCLYGGDEGLVKKLDETFIADSKLEGKEQSDISGMIGQYAQGNEPSHHMAYLYNYTSQPWKTQKWVRKIMNNMYHASPDGLSGNEDCGQMSAWFVLSALGIYQVCPGSDQYEVGTPLFDKATISLDNGKQFIIEAKGISSKDIYIQSVKMNNEPYDKDYISYGDIMEGAKIDINMGAEPNISWGIKKEDQPYSFSKIDFVSPPYQKNNITYFKNFAIVDLTTLTKDSEIHYTLDGSKPGENSKLFNEPFKINSTTIIKAIAFKDGMNPSPVSLIEANKLVYLEPVELKKTVNGINYEYYEGNFLSVHDFSLDKPLKTGTLKNFEINNAQQEDHFGFKYSGYIKILKDGIYYFSTLSDDGSVLYINDKEIVSNDGSHGPLEASGMIALKKGFHKFTLLYFEDYEGNSLEVKFEGPEIEKQLIPDSLLYR